MTSSAIQPTSTLTARALGLAAGGVQGVLARAGAYHRRRVTRRQIESLSVEQLRDVGIDPDVISRAHEVPGDPWTMSRLLSLR